MAIVNFSGNTIIDCGDDFEGSVPICINYNGPDVDDTSFDDISGNDIIDLDGCIGSLL